MGTLRFLLALCVVVTHSSGGTVFGHSLFAGETAVQGFYIVSGFLITMVLNTRPEYRSISNFYISRYLRLWPAYAVVALLALVLLKSATWPAAVAKLDIAGAAFVVASNAIIFFQDLFLFLAVNPDGSLYFTSHFATEPGTPLHTLLLVPQMWTVGIEMTFYAVAPFVCRSPARLTGLFVFGTAVRLALGYWSPPDVDPWHYRFAPAEMMLFAGGGLAWFAGESIRRRVPELAMQIVGCICLAALAFIIIATPVEVQSFSKTLLLLNPRLLALIVISCPFLISLSRLWKFDGAIGELSYPMYLSHFFINEAMSRYTPSLMTPDNFTYVCVTIALSFALFRLVALPVDSFRQRFGAARVTENYNRWQCTGRSHRCRQPRWLRW